MPLHFKYHIYLKNQNIIKKVIQLNEVKNESIKT